MDTQLSNAQSNKLDPRLLSWLDGEEAAELGLAAGDDPGTVRVSVQLSSPLTEDDLARYEAFGLTAEAGADDLFGQVTREGLSALARDSRVLQIQPVGMSAPSGSTF